jgi:hypothetical protein
MAVSYPILRSVYNIMPSICYLLSSSVDASSVRTSKRFTDYKGEFFLTREAIVYYLILLYVVRGLVYNRYKTNNYTRKISCQELEARSKPYQMIVNTKHLENPYIQFVSSPARQLNHGNSRTPCP